MLKTFFGLFQNIKTTENVSYGNITNSRVVINGVVMNNDDTNIININGIEIKIENSNKNITIIVEGNVDKLQVGTCDTVTVHGKVNDVKNNVGKIIINDSINGNVTNNTGSITVHGTIHGNVKTNVGSINHIK